MSTPPAPLHQTTPLLERADAGGRRLALKMECWQPAGSFKIRGIGRLCQGLVAAGATELVSSSGGNAGMAAAWAGRALGVAARVVVPRTTGADVIAALRALGARVEVYGAVWDEADERARALAAEPARGYVPPFDHPQIWAGHATLVEECAEQGAKPDAVVLSVGGGGLLCGVLEGMHRVGWADVPVHAVETEGAASLRAAMDAGGPVAIPEIRSLATTLGARRVADAAWEWTQRHAIESVQVTDAQAVAACLAFADRHRVLVEPACGAALAAATSAAPAGARVLVVVCGGAGVTLGKLARWRQACGLR